MTFVNAPVTVLNCDSVTLISSLIIIIIIMICHKYYTREWVGLNLWHYVLDCWCNWVEDADADVCVMWLLQLLQDASSFVDHLGNWELVLWCLTLSVFLMRYVTLGTSINKKYRNFSVLITEQVTLTMRQSVSLSVSIIMLQYCPTL